MRLIHACLPCTEADDRIDLFRSRLNKVTENIHVSEAQFFISKGHSFPDFTDDGKLIRIRFAHEEFLALIYEESKTSQISSILREIIAEIWPERDNIQVYETVVSKDPEKPHTLWLIRGDKKPSEQ